MDAPIPPEVSRPATTTSDFDARYQIVEHEAMVAAELAVTGSDYGANSYTTREQADLLASEMRLRPGMNLLDVGSGAGWPGIYLAASTGCSVVLTDLPFEGLKIAARRIRRDGERVAVINAGGGDLPLRDESFDAATSSDVFC